MGHRPEVKCSIMAAKISGLSTLHTYSSLFVTVTKSDPKKTPDTPSMANRRFASGELNPSLAESKLFDPLCAPLFLYTTHQMLLYFNHISKHLHPRNVSLLQVCAAMQCPGVHQPVKRWRCPLPSML